MTTSTRTRKPVAVAVPVNLEKSATFVSLVKKEAPVIPVSDIVASVSSEAVVLAPKRRGRPVGSSGPRKVSEVTLASTQVLSERNGVFLLAIDAGGRQVRIRLGSVSAMREVAASLQQEISLLCMF